MRKTWIGLGRSSFRRLYCRPSICLAVLTFCALLPFVSFGDFVDDYIETNGVFSTRCYMFTRNAATPAGHSQFSARSSDVFFYWATYPNGIRFSKGYPEYDYPAHPNAVVGSTPTLYHQCWYAQGTNTHAFSFLRISQIREAYSFVRELLDSGYRSPVLTVYRDDNLYFTGNFVYNKIVGDVVTSTNTLFRSILIKHLSAISSSIQNIDSNVSSLSSTMQQGYDDIVDALIGDYPELQAELKKGNTRAVDVRTSIKSQLQAWRSQATQQLDDWKADLKSDLQAWKTSDETGILNVRQHIQDVTAAVDDMKNQFSTFDSRGDAVPYSAFTTNFVTVPITNVVTQSGNEIISNIQQAANTLDDRLYDIWDRFWNTAGRPDSDGINVRIVHPTDGDNHVLVKDDAVLRVLEDGVTFVSPELTQISDAWDSFLASYSPTNSLDWEPWFSKWVPFSDTVTNYYAEFNSSAPASDIAADFLERGFDGDRYSALPWFERVEVLLAMIADVRSNAVEVADIQEAMEEQVSNFQALSTNVVSVSSDVVGLFEYVRRFSASLQSIFGDRAAPLTGDYVLLPAGRWIGDTPLVLRVNPTIQNFCRLIMQCIWYLSFLVLLWVVVSWVWSKVVAVLRWLWSMFDV